MSWLGRLAALAFGLGVLAVIAPGLLSVPVDRAFVAVLGVVALVQAYGVVVARLRTGRDRTETADPEVLRRSPVPGEDGPGAVEGGFGGHWYVRRSELRAAAVAVLTRFHGLTEEVARERVVDGSWCDDPLAAAHLAEDAWPVPFADRIGGLLRRESAYRRGRRRAIEAIAGLAGVASDRASAGDHPPRAAEGRRPDRGGVGDEPGQRTTGHLRGVGVVALLAVGAGVLTGTPTVVLAGVVGVGFAAYARAGTPPDVDLTVERSIDADGVEPSERVEVTLTVRNDGGSALPDVRLVDGVPGGLTVASGSPRLGTALRAGEAVTVRYEVEARRGVHEFDHVTVLARDLAAANETYRRVPAASTLRCVPTLRPTGGPVPLRSTATRIAGRVQTSVGGDGVEFHATRPYQPGDPTNRIDWNRRARTGDLATLEFREERAATVVVAIDAREPCFVAPSPHAPHAVDRAVKAGGRLFAALAADGNRVGIAVLGTDGWLPPGSGPAHAARARDLLATHPGLSADGPAGSTTGRWRRRLDRRLPTDAQLLVLSPLTDPASGRLVRTLDARGHRATVVSPDPTVTDGPGPLLATVARRLRVTDLRRSGVPVVDWSPRVSLEAALARAGGGDRP